MSMHKKRVLFGGNLFPYLLMLVSILAIGYITVISNISVNDSSIGMSQYFNREKEVHIKWSPWLRIGEWELLEDRVSKFNETQDRIRIEMLPLSKKHYEREILVDMMTGKAPDVFYASEEFLQLLARDKKIHDLTEDFIAWEKSKDFLPELIRIGSRNGHLFGIPIEMESLVVYFNKDMFELKGLHSPTKLYAQGRWNWDTLEETARIISLNSATRDIYGLILRNWWATNYSFIYQNGGIIFDQDGKVVINSKQVRETIRFLRNMVEDGSLLFMETTQEGGTYADIFRQQRAGMIISGGTLSSDFKRTITDFNWDIAPLPAGRYGHRGSSTFVSFICINKDSQYKEYAWDFIRFLAGSENLKNQMNDGSRFMSPLKLLLPEFAGRFDDALYARFIPLSHLLWPEVGRAINQGFVQIWAGESENAELYLGQLAAETNVMLRRILETEVEYAGQRR